MANVFDQTLVTAVTETPGGAPPPPPPPGYAPPHGGPPANAPSPSGKAIASLILGIVGLCIGWIPIVGIIGFVTAILAIVLGFLGKKEIEASGGQITGSGMAIAGIVLGFVQIVLVIAVLAFVGSIFAEFDRVVEESQQIALLWS